METIDTVQLRLTALWVALMLIYLLGDVLRIFSGDFKAGEIMGSQVTQPMWLGIAALMVIPILMIILTMTLGQGANRWLNILWTLWQREDCYDEARHLQNLVRYRPAPPLR